MLREMAFRITPPPDPCRQHPVSVLLGDQRAIHGVDLGIRVLIEEIPFGRGSVQQQALAAMESEGLDVI
jgi:hypothetical protein